MPRLTDEQVDDLVDEWHQGSSNQELWQFLEFTFDEYEEWAVTGICPDMDEPRYLKALNKL